MKEAEPSNSYRVALTFIDEHGADAKYKAIEEVVECVALGDWQHAAVWRLVFAAIVELQISPNTRRMLH